ncbi:hypothetical protein [Alkalibacterium kapii]|uniref:Uncharacterized protein n=1 Tax=Alkalibacterium kapii TaxID=426704 RepID=A0A511AV09_9LACT|nr:hypothetical protein [Alkalibacterium kapii]GEK91183.1 hypothetical protein AKA01nite_08050 [Alkalibacterium kapii]
MSLFYFALVLSVFLFLKEEKEVKKLLTAVDTYKKPFKIGTFITVIFQGLFITPFESSGTIILRAVFYLFVGMIMYGLYKNQPLKVFLVVVMLHLLGLTGRITLEWTETIPMKLYEVAIPLVILSLYIYIIQLFLTLKRFS